MAGNDLTAVLADRLAAIVPAGFYVDAADGMLWYSADEGRFPGQQGNYQVGRAGTHIQDVYGDADEENIADIAAQALDHLQDYVSEATHDPWPGTTAQPRPNATVRDSTLYLWYGDQDNVILACEPIPLSGQAQ